MMRAYLLLFFYGAAALGCADKEPCAGAGGTSVVKGNSSDFITKPGDYAGYHVTAPEPCDGKGHIIKVRGTGARKLGFIPDAGCPNLPVSGDGGAGGDRGEVTCPVISGYGFSHAVRAAAREAFISTYEPWICSVPYRGILIDDWSQADEATAIVGQKVEEWNLGETVDVVISPLLYECF
jgi:hypothetical protein